MLDRKAFDSMLQSAEPDKTMANLFKQEKKDTTKDLHNTLMLAGFSPAYGNIADAVDALLYATEGEFGEAALSGASAIPIIGQFVAGKRALKAAKEAGEEMVTVYRGVPTWWKGKMVKDGKFIGGGKSGKHSFWTTDSKKYAASYANRLSKAPEYSHLRDYVLKGEKSRPSILEFEMPSSWAKNNLRTAPVKQGGGLTYIFDEGIPKEFLTKVHK